jgi:uncharacterized protein (DUF1778 family)
MAATARLDLRLSLKDRQRIDRAAEAVATLSPVELQRFLAALGKPFAPNAALRKALKRGDGLGI